MQVREGRGTVSSGYNERSRQAGVEAGVHTGQEPLGRVDWCLRPDHICRLPGTITP